MKPLRSLLVVANTDAYAAVHMGDFLGRLSGAGVQVHVLTPAGAFLDELRARGFAWTRLPLARGRRGLLSAPGAIRALRRAQHQLQVRPDLILAVTAVPVLLATIANRMTSADPPVLGVVPGLGHFFVAGREKGAEAAILREGFRWAVRRGTTLIFQHATDRTKVLGHNRDWIARSDVIPGWGVELRRFSPPSEPTGLPIVVMISRLLRDKGVGDFVEAARALRAAGEEARFVLIGETDPGNPGAIGAEQLEQWTAEGVVEWWGRQADIPSILARSSVLALPTRYGEGVPRVLVEAGAASLPVVVGDVPGCCAIVEHQRNGLVVSPGDPAELAEAMQALLHLPDRRRAMGIANRRRVEQEFDVVRVLARYKEILARHGLELQGWLS